MKSVLLSLSCVGVFILALPSLGHANELRSSNPHDGVSLPSVSSLVFTANSPKYRFLQAGYSDYSADPMAPSLTVKVKRLRSAGTVFFAISAFPFLPVGITLSTSADNFDAAKVGGALVGVSSSLILYGILMFIHADILEKKEMQAAWSNRDWSRSTHDERSQPKPPQSVPMQHRDERDANWVSSSREESLYNEILNDANTPGIPEQHRPVNDEARSQSVLMQYLDERGAGWAPSSREEALRLFDEILDDAAMPDIPELRRPIIDEALLRLGFDTLPSDWGEPEEERLDLDFSEELEDLTETEIDQ